MSHTPMRMVIIKTKNNKKQNATSVGGDMEILPRGI